MPGGAESDLELVVAARQGGHAAFAALVARHRAVLVSVCRRALRDVDLAEDAVQEATVLAWLNLDRLREPRRFGAWLCGIGLHVSQVWLRRQRYSGWSLEALIGGRQMVEPIDLQPAPHLVAEEAELAHAVRRAVEALPSGQRAAVALFYLGGLTYAEVAAALGIELSAVKTRLHKARGALARSLFATWEDYTMTTETTSATEWLDVSLEDVVRFDVGDPAAYRTVLLLSENDRDRLLPIWVGHFEGDAAAILLVGAETPRPLTYPFTARVLEAAGGKVLEARISRLVDETFFAELVISSSRGQQIVDSRPSDAIALAVATGAPIRVEREVMEQAGRTRAELADTRPGEARSARLHADAIRAHTSQSSRSWHGSHDLF